MIDYLIKSCHQTLTENTINELIDEINKKDSIIETDPLDSELRILDWILYIVCSNEIKKL